MGGEEQQPSFIHFIQRCSYTNSGSVSSNSSRDLCIGYPMNHLVAMYYHLSPVCIDLFLEKGLSDESAPYTDRAPAIIVSINLVVKTSR
jgi:hypothetical protein